MATVREDALAAVYGRLAAIASIAGLTTYRNPHFQMDAFPALCLMDGGHNIADVVEGLKIYDVEAVIEGYVEAGTNGDPDSGGTVTGTRLSELYGETVKALLSDRTVPEMDVWEGDMTVDLVVDEGVKPHMVFALAIRVRVQTSDIDPTLSPT